VIDAIRQASGYYGVNSASQARSILPFELNEEEEGQYGQAADGFKASREIQSLNDQKGQAPPDEKGQPKQGSGAGMAWAMMGLSIANNVINRLFGGGSGGSGGSCQGGG